MGKRRKGNKKEGEKERNGRATSVEFLVRGHCGGTKAMKGARAVRVILQQGTSTNGQPRAMPSSGWRCGSRDR